MGGLLAVILAIGPWRNGWKAACGTALRPALAWALVALAIAAVAEIAGLSESWRSGRPIAGQIMYLASLATIAGLVSVLNARRPGNAAWAMLMGLLVVVMLVPWLEGFGLAAGTDAWDRLRIEGVWALFFVLLTGVGVANYVPTRFGLAAVCLGAGLLLEAAALYDVDATRAARGSMWVAYPVFLGAAFVVANWTARVVQPTVSGKNRLWTWFRDAWGVVWALRVQERLNRAAGLASGAEPSDRDLETLKALLRRFADKSRLDEIAGGDSSA